MIKRLIILIFAVLFISSPAIADEMYISVGGSYVIENIDTETDLINLDNTKGLNFRAGKIINNNLSLELTYDYLESFTWSGYGLDIDVDIQTLILAGKLTAGNEVKPYLTAGAGLMKGELNLSSLISASASETDLCAKAGAGIDFKLTDKISLGTEAAYILGLNDLDMVEYTQLTCGVAYHF